MEGKGGIVITMEPEADAEPEDTEFADAFVDKGTKFFLSFALTTDAGCGATEVPSRGAVLAISDWTAARSGVAAFVVFVDVIPRDGCLLLRPSLCPWTRS